MAGRGVKETEGDKERDLEGGVKPHFYSEDLLIDVGDEMLDELIVDLSLVKS